MVEKEIIYSKDAIGDIKGIHDYLERGSLQYAKSFIKGLYSAIDELRDLPQKCAVLPQNKRYRILDLASNELSTLLELIGELKSLIGLDYYN